MIPRIVDDNARYHVSQFQFNELPSLRRIRGLLSAKAQRSAQKSRRTELKKAMSLDEIEAKQQQRGARRRRRASVTIFTRVKSWDDLSKSDALNDSNSSNNFHSVIDCECRPSEDVKKLTFRSQSFEETPDTAPRRPRRSSCMGSTTPSHQMQHQHASPSRSPTLGNSFQENNDFRPIRPRRSSLAMYETGANGSKEESLRTIWSQTSSDACPTLPQRLFMPADSESSLGNSPRGIVSRDGSVCFPAVA